MSEISLVLKYLRTQKGVYQKQIATDLNIETNTYGSWERGNTEPPIDMLIALAKYYGVSVDYLVGVEKEDFTKISKCDDTSDNLLDRELLKVFKKLKDNNKYELLNYAHYLENKKA